MGGPEVLQVVEVPAPTPAAGQVLIGVEAVGVGPWDTRMRAGSFGPQPTPYIPGAELAGTVVEVGAEVTGFSVGDRVWAHPGLTGAMAELVALDVGAVGRAPADLSPVEAATVPVGGLAAAQSLELLDPKEGEVVLVMAAGGNVGSFAVQLAHSRGAVVIAQAGADDAERLTSLGAGLSSTGGATGWVRCSRRPPTASTRCSTRWAETS
jgi:NADPH:quinone reductase-like Zn-dependent oxidoreductase